jgi:hypothetical protein
MLLQRDINVPSTIFRNKLDFLKKIRDKEVGGVVVVVESLSAPQK